MTESIIVALITAGGALLGNLIMTKAQYNKILIELKAELSQMKMETELKMDSFKKDIARLETKQDKHNSVVERQYKIEERTSLQDAELKRHDERLKALEAKG